MKSTNLGPGEMADRLTILALKIAFGQERGLDVTHFVTERNILLVAIRTSALEGWLEHLLDLSACNAILWHAEDRLRDFRRGKSQDPEALQVAYFIQSTNDKRAELVRAINQRTGGPDHAEKL